MTNSWRTLLSAISVGQMVKPAAAIEIAEDAAHLRD
jgi:hypothetical protein